VWFYSKRGPAIMALTTVYTVVCEALLIWLDKTVKLKDTFQSAVAEGGALSGIITGLAGSDSTAQANWRGTLTEAIINWILPTIFMVGLIILLLVILRFAWRDIDRSEVVIALFTGFVVSYALLTFVGTAMRGPGMDLYPPWAVPPVQRGGFDLLLQLLRLG
jgi:hypothetical protein